MKFILFTILGFIGLELVSYLAHRWLFHGVLWPIHISHHTRRRRWFETNDIFSVAFGSLSVGLIVFAEAPWAESIAFPIGLGIAIYGCLYFIVHDIFTHRRFFAFSSKNRVLLTIRAAHQRHHQTSEKRGFEPFGLFIFNYKNFFQKIRRSGQSPES